ncbi:MAG: hypothetical protein QM532_02360 [Cyanobium sp. MAG06]|nr:hypothetical protein [Cyanobium sp. MAG06]
MLKLLEKGVLITTDYGQGILFEYSNINDIKSELLSVAIFNAEKSARQFADNAGVMLNKLANANQGQIDITDKDPGSPEYKKLRLVGTFRYLIK